MAKAIAVEVGKTYLAKGMRHRYQNGMPVKVVSLKGMLEGLDLIDADGSNWGMGAENLRPAPFDLDDIKPGCIVAVDWQDGSNYLCIIRKYTFGGAIEVSSFDGKLIEEYTINGADIRAAATVDCSMNLPDFRKAVKVVFDGWKKLAKVNCEAPTDWATVGDEWQLRRSVQK